jgi:hypothetical protein
MQIKNEAIVTFLIKQIVIPLEQRGYWRVQLTHRGFNALTSLKTLPMVFQIEVRFSRKTYIQPIKK